MQPRQLGGVVEKILLGFPLSGEPANKSGRDHATKTPHSWAKPCEIACKR